MSIDNKGLDINLVRGMLDTLSPDGPYSTWSLIGCSLYSEFGEDAHDLFYEWSKGGNSFREKEFNRQWENIAKNNQKITIGSVIHLAIQAGYQPPKN